MCIAAEWWISYLAVQGRVSLGFKSSFLWRLQQLVACSSSQSQNEIVQKRHFYTGNLNLETFEDSEKAFLHCEDVLGQWAVPYTASTGDNPVQALNTDSDHTMTWHM